MESQSSKHGALLLDACPNTVLAVDLDGTLIFTDMLRDGVVQALRANPLAMVPLAWALLRSGRPGVKQAVASRVAVMPAGLPYNPDILDLIRSWRAAGRSVMLVTAAAEDVAERIAAHLGLFDAVHASRSGRNLKGRAKAAFLVREYGARGFVYAGDSSADLHVWTHAAGAALASDNPRLKARLQDMGIPVQMVTGRR